MRGNLRPLEIVTIWWHLQHRGRDDWFNWAMELTEVRNFRNRPGEKHSEMVGINFAVRPSWNAVMERMQEHASMDLAKRMSKSVVPLALQPTARDFYVDQTNKDLSGDLRLRAWLAEPDILFFKDPECRKAFYRSVIENATLWACYLPSLRLRVPRRYYDVAKKATAHVTEADKRALAEKCIASAPVALTQQLLGHLEFPMDGRELIRPFAMAALTVTKFTPVGEVNDASMQIFNTRVSEECYAETA